MVKKAPDVFQHFVASEHFKCYVELWGWHDRSIHLYMYLCVVWLHTTRLCVSGDSTLHTNWPIKPHTHIN